MQPEPVETVAEVAAVPVVVAVAAASVAQVSIPAKPDPVVSAKPETAPRPVAATTESIVVKAETKAVEEFEPNMLANSDQEPVQLALATAAPILTMDDREYQRQLAIYVSEVMKSVFSNVKYPRRAIKRQREGKVEMLATLTAEGELAGLTLERTSGHDILDKAAVKAILNAAPFPPLSDVAQEEFLSENGSTYMVMIPVTFRLQ
jgi:protein TonB